MVHDTLHSRQTLTVNGKQYDIYSLKKAAESLKKDISRLPFSLKVLFENLLRYEDGNTVTQQDIEALADWVAKGASDREIAYRPARVLMQDFTGVPAVVDLAAMRDAMQALGGDPRKINPLAPVDLVIDHSVQVDAFGSAHAFHDNVELEMERNRERYEFLKWGQKAFDNFRVVPPGTGICHQVNLEYLAQVVWTNSIDGRTVAYPDTLVGTDSHTTMVNGLAVLGWGVGGIEAEAAMLGQPTSMLIPDVIGFKLTGKLPEGATATDLVLTVTQMLRKRGVVGKFVEFYGSGLADLALADRATIANMAPEYGATCGFFPIDKETIRYMRLTGRDDDRIALVEAYAKEQGMWRDDHTPDPVFTDTLELDLSSIQPSLAGPRRPQDRVLLSDMSSVFGKELPSLMKTQSAPTKRVTVNGESYDLGHGDVVIAAITSCTNTSNPSVMIAAGLVARNAHKKGLTVKPWVKTSLAPGSKVVTEYFRASNLQNDLDALGFNLVGYGCTTCIGNSGPLPEPIDKAIVENDLVVASVLSGNRNFEGRVHPNVRANYLASPPLVVAYALAGSVNINLTTDPLGVDTDGNPVYLRDIWPTNQEIAEIVEQVITGEMFRKRYADVFQGDDHWQKVPVSEGLTYNWSNNSTYIKKPPYFDGMKAEKPALHDVHGAKLLAILGDSITTDHISPAGNISKDSPAAKYLESHGVERRDFNSYGARRGHDEVMTRGTFANVRIQNALAPGKEGGYTTYNGQVMSIFDAAMQYKSKHTPLVVIAGKEYGTGSSRDWAAKGTNLLGIKAVIAESFERIHRSNLVGMGILPLQFKDGMNREKLALDGSETLDFSGFAAHPEAGMTVDCVIHRADGSTQTVPLLCRIDTADEVEYFKNGGILHNVLRSILYSKDSKVA